MDASQVEKEVQLLLNFYKVKTLTELVIEQANHVERLQKRLAEQQKTLQPFYMGTPRIG